MKKTVVLAIVACLATAAPALAQAEKKMPAKPMAAQAGVNDTLMKYENELLAMFAKKDFASFKKRIVPGSWSIDEGGATTIDDLIKQVTDPKANLTWSYKVSDMKVVDLGTGTKAVTYTVDQTGSMMGQPFPPRVYSTTVWANHGGSWMAVFHQESTAAKK